MTGADPALQAHLDWLHHRRLSDDTLKLRTVALGLITRHTGKPLLDVTADDLDTWQATLHVADSSRHTYIAQVRAFYAWTVVHGLTTTDPSIWLLPPRVRRGKPRPISEPDLRLALATAPPRILPWLELAAYAGLRAREISLLTRDAIHDGQPEPCLIADGKGRRERVVPLAPRVWDALCAHGLPAEGFVFGRLDGEPGPIPAHRVSHLASEHLHSVGVNCTLHQLRHRFLSEIYRATKDLRLTQELAGHSSPVTTSVYTDWSREAAAVAVADLGRRTA